MGYFLLGTRVLCRTGRKEGKGKDPPMRRKEREKTPRQTESVLPRRSAEQILEHDRTGQGRRGERRASEARQGKDGRRDGKMKESKRGMRCEKTTTFDYHPAPLELFICPMTL